MAWNVRGSWRWRNSEFADRGFPCLQRLTSHLITWAVCVIESVPLYRLIKERSLFIKLRIGTTLIFGVVIFGVIWEGDYEFEAWYVRLVDKKLCLLNHYCYHFHSGQPLICSAPMQDVTDLAFMQMLSEYGCPDYYVTEYLSLSNSNIDKRFSTNYFKHHRPSCLCSQIIGGEHSW
jgi:hypothetical protein